MGTDTSHSRLIHEASISIILKTINGGSLLEGKVIPFPRTCCGCSSTYHKPISRGLYHCSNCGKNCGRTVS